MRLLSVLAVFLLLNACASSKKSKQERINSAYDARTEAQRNQPARPTVRLAETPGAAMPNAPAPRPSAAGVAAPVRENVPSRAATPSVATPAAGTNPATLAAHTGEWVVTSIKGKFLAIDTTNVRVFMDITAKNPASEPVLNPGNFTEHFQIAYVMYPDYNNRERLGYGTVPLSAQNVSVQGDHLTLMFDIKRPKDAANAILLTEITETNTGTKARNDLPLRFRNLKLSDRFALFDTKNARIELRNYGNVNDTLVIRDVNGTRKPLYGVRYRHDFDAASSPMNTQPRPTSRSLNVDSTLTITTNEPFVLPREGLYYFVEDTTAESGIGLFIADNRYPKMTRPQKLIKPVLYMSTSTEINELSQAADTKKAFDRYWLTLMAGNEDMARRTIRAYFDRVEEANRLFTTYKEGWKTDKGMIYIILGAPDRVQRNREREVWVYNRRTNAAEVNFTFNKKPNQFVDDHYELARFIEYQPIWYPIVEAWRTGTIRE